jgi:predicted aspartyl protease
MIKKIIHKFLNIHPDAMSFQNSMDLAELPVVTFRQGDKKINFLLDTGSNNCVIDSNILKSIDHKMLDVETNILGLEGNAQKTGVCTIKMSYKNKEYEYPYVIQDMSAAFDSIKKETGVTVNGMLGSKFFNEFKYVLDFDELIAYSKE